ncbi:MAG TPA: DUF58 domain-containing protein [Vicinamibacterales bacterium]
MLAAIADLELVARVTVDGTIAGLHRSPFHGYSAEFSQYRQYRPGDDLKYVDWKLFARTDRVYTKQYRETTNMVAQVAIDASASMAYGGRAGVTKIDYARLLAAGLAHLVATQGDAVGLVTFDEQLRTYLPARSGPSHLRRVLVALSSLAASGATSLSTPLRRAVDLMRRRGLLVLISDLYDEDASVESELKRASRMGHEVALFHVLTPEEVTFSVGGDVELEDLESHARAMVGGATAAEYRAAFERFLSRWRERCATYGFSYTQVTTDMPLDQALRGYLLKRMRGL